MKFSASAIIVLMLIVSMLALAASADKHRQLKSRKGKGNKSSKKQPQPPGPQPQCETMDLYVLGNYDNDCVRVTDPFAGRQQFAYNDIGYSQYRAIYGPPDEDGFFTDPPIGIKFESYQDGPAIPSQYEGEMEDIGWYKLAAGFMLDPTPTRFVAAPDTLYRSSVWCFCHNPFKIGDSQAFLHFYLVCQFSYMILLNLFFYRILMFVILTY